jgi:hypothetical protein
MDEGAVLAPHLQPCTAEFRIIAGKTGSCVEVYLKLHVIQTSCGVHFHSITVSALLLPAFGVVQRKAREEALQVVAEGAGGLADSARDAAGLLQDAAAGVHKHNKRASSQHAANNQEL